MGESDRGLPLSARPLPCVDVKVPWTCGALLLVENVDDGAGARVLNLRAFAATVASVDVDIVDEGVLEMASAVAAYHVYRSYTNARIHICTFSRMKKNYLGDKTSRKHSPTVQ